MLKDCRVPYEVVFGENWHKVKEIKMFKDSDKFDVKVVNGQLVISKIEENKMKLKDKGFYKVRGTGEVVQVTKDPKGGFYSFSYFRKDGSTVDVTNYGFYWQGGEHHDEDLIEEVSVPDNKMLGLTFEQLQKLCLATGTVLTLAILQKLGSVYNSFSRE